MYTYDKITGRVSIRQYSASSVEPEKISRIREHIKKMIPLYEGLESRYEIVEDGSKIHSIMSGFIGSYGKNNAPHFIVAISRTGEGARENVGFMLEQLVLEMTEMGLGTCWIGGFFDRKKIRSVVEMKDDEEVWVIISFGYPAETTGAALFNKGLRKLFGSTRRKSIEDIVCLQKWGNDIKTYLSSNERYGRIMEAARIAPSAANTQPWRFVVDDGKIVLFNKRAGGHIREMNFIDAGITLCHIYLAALEEGFNISIEREKPGSAAYNVPGDFTYITTCKLK